MIDMQEYVGKEIIGFKFKDTPYVDYLEYEHGEYIGVTGTIVEVEKDNDEGDYSCKVQFPDDETWYPMEGIDAYIVNEEPVDLDKLFKEISMI